MTRQSGKVWVLPVRRDSRRARDVLQAYNPTQLVTIDDIISGCAAEWIDAWTGSVQLRAVVADELQAVSDEGVLRSVWRN